MSGGPPLVPVAWGELIDKLTILEIKREEIRGPGALANVEREYALLTDALGAAADAHPEVVELREQLRGINRQLWDVEDDLRALEAARDFGPHFVELARSVYRLNDRRAALKRAISTAMGSAIVEEKSYADYGAGEESA